MWFSDAPLFFRYNVFQGSAARVTTRSQDDVIDKRLEDCMSILWLIIVGAVIGVVARFLMPGRDPIGIIGTILLGIVGAVLGGLAMDALLPNNDNDGVPVIAGIVTAMILLFVYRKLTYGRRSNALR